MGRTMTKEDILALAGRRQTFAVSIPGWGGTIRLAVMTAGERAELEQLPTDGKMPVNWRSLLLARCIVDDKGEPLFTAEDDINKLMELPANGVETLTREAMRLNGFGTDLGKDI